MKLLNAISSPTEVGNRENVVFLITTSFKARNRRNGVPSLLQDSKSSRQLCPTEVGNKENVSFSQNLIKNQ